MPIHTSWKSMAKNMVSSGSRYCKRNPKRKCYPFTDGTKLCGCAGGWSVFFATINKMGADETKPRPSTKTQESKEKVIEWFVESTLKSSDVPANLIPNWIILARKIIKSPKFNKKVKAYWQNRLDTWCRKNPKLCKGIKND